MPGQHEFFYRGRGHRGGLEVAMIWPNLQDQKLWVFGTSLPLESIRGSLWIHPCCHLANRIGLVAYERLEREDLRARCVAELRPSGALFANHG